MKDLVHERKMDTLEIRLRCIVSAAICISDRNSLLCGTHSFVKRLRMCIEAEGGHFELFFYSIESPGYVNYLQPLLIVSCYNGHNSSYSDHFNSLCPWFCIRWEVYHVLTSCRTISRIGIELIARVGFSTLIRNESFKCYIIASLLI
jgi:hypothetical protein